MLISSLFKSHLERSKEDYLSWKIETNMFLYNKFYNSVRQEISEGKISKQELLSYTCMIPMGGQVISNCSDQLLKKLEKKSHVSMDIVIDRIVCARANTFMRNQCETIQLKLLENLYHHFYALSWKYCTHDCHAPIINEIYNGWKKSSLDIDFIMPLVNLKKPEKIHVLLWELKRCGHRKNMYKRAKEEIYRSCKITEHITSIQQKLSTIGVHMSWTLVFLFQGDVSEKTYLDIQRAGYKWVWEHEMQDCPINVLKRLVPLL